MTVAARIALEIWDTLYGCGPKPAVEKDSSLDSSDSGLDSNPVGDSDSDPYDSNYGTDSDYVPNTSDPDLRQTNHPSISIYSSSTSPLKSALQDGDRIAEWDGAVTDLIRDINNGVLTEDNVNEYENYPATYFANVQSSLRDVNQRQEISYFVLMAGNARNQASTLPDASSLTQGAEVALPNLAQPYAFVATNVIYDTKGTEDESDDTVISASRVATSLGEKHEDSNSGEIVVRGLYYAATARTAENAQMTIMKNSAITYSNSSINPENELDMILRLQIAIEQASLFATGESNSSYFTVSYTGI